MATVRFSGDLISSINNRAMSMFNSQYEKAREVDLSDRDWAMWIYDKMFTPDERAHMQAISTMLMTTSVINVSTINGVMTSHVFKFTDEMPWPHNRYKSDIAKISSYTMGGVTLHTDCWAELQTLFDDRNARMKQVEDSRNEFTKGVRALVQKHTTLAPALREWPPLWDLLPEETKERHKRKVVRASAQPTVDSDGEQIDFSKLTAVVGRNKILGGK